MSLTSHLKDNGSRFGNSCVLSSRILRNPGGCRKQVREAHLIRPDTDAFVPWSTIGVALDYRIRYYFAVTPYVELVAHHGARKLAIARDSLILRTPRRRVSLRDEHRDFFNSLGTFMGDNNPIAKRLPHIEEDKLNRYCFVLALMDLA